jgi:hypothetical protein
MQTRKITQGVRYKKSIAQPRCIPAHLPMIAESLAQSVSQNCNRKRKLTLGPCSPPKFIACSLKVWGAVDYKRDDGHAYWGTTPLPIATVGTPNAVAAASSRAISNRLRGHETDR